MKTKNILLLCAFVCALLFVPAVVRAADAVAALTPATTATAPSGFTAENIVQWLTPLLVPLIITGLKKVMPSVPSWALPILAPVLGMLLELINSYANSHSSNFLVAALLGLAGVGVREIKTNIIPPKVVA